MNLNLDFRIISLTSIKTNNITISDTKPRIHNVPNDNGDWKRPRESYNTPNQLYTIICQANNNKELRPIYLRILIVFLRDNNIIKNIPHKAAIKV